MPPAKWDSSTRRAESWTQVEKRYCTITIHRGISDYCTGMTSSILPPKNSRSQSPGADKRYQRFQRQLEERRDGEFARFFITDDIRNPAMELFNNSQLAAARLAKDGQAYGMPHAVKKKSMIYYQNQMIRRTSDHFVQQWKSNCCC